MTRLVSHVTRFAWFSSLFFACSVLNTFDDVEPELQVEAGAGGQGSSGSPSGGSESVGGDPAAGAAGQAPDPSTAGSGGEAPVELPTTGLVVVAGSDLSAGGPGDAVIATLDPDSGEVLSRDPLTGAAVVGLGYDDSSNLWYVFTASAFPADPSSKADLQVRAYDDDSNTWSVVSRVTALPPPHPNGVVVLNDRLAYLSFEVDGGLRNAVTVLDISDPERVAPIVYTQPTLDGEALGIVGSRGAPGDDTVLGGTVAVALATGCGGAGRSRVCSSLSLSPIFVGDAISGGLAVDFGAFGGVPGFASARSEQRAFLALPSATNGENVRVIAFDPRTPNADRSQLAPSSARLIGGVAYAECEQVTAISSVDAGTLFALTNAGLAASNGLQRAGQLVAYEPFGQHLIVPFNPDSTLFPDSSSGAGGAPADPAIDAYAAERAGANVSLSKLAAGEWSAPDDIAVDLVATRYPRELSCP